MKKMTYEETLNWIHDQLKFGIKPGVRRMEWMLNELGNPQNQIKGIHVVGTNGKGSTTNYLQHIFSQAGYEVGTFTSPYIMDFRERIALNGRMISQDDLVALAEIVRPVVERLPKETNLKSATEFEIITTMMFVYFGSYHPVDIAIIEAGLGGLYDSTNVFNPLAVICTSIGLDHQNILGASYQDIASQKVGVLKDRIPFIFSEKREEVREIFYQRAQELHCPTYELGNDFRVSGNSTAFDFYWKDYHVSSIKLAMLGQHQVSNASLATMTSLLLTQKFPKVTINVIKSALSQARWLGRTELMRPNLMIDGAHNDESIAVLTDVLKENYSSHRIHILFAAIDTKPVETMLEKLSVFDSLTVTTFNYPNSITLESYPDRYRKIRDFQAWLSEYVTISDNDLYVITGSLYFISQVRTYLLGEA